jgi:hypothetical protein
VDQLSEGILKELARVEGRYIEWEWDPRPQADDHIAMRESGGELVQMAHAGGRVQYQNVPVRSLEELIAQQLVCEDRSKWASGFRLYRLTVEGRRRTGPSECGPA